MATNKEYEQWKNDPVVQQEYSKYLLEKELKKDPVPQDFINQFTRNFNKIFKEKS